MDLLRELAKIKFGNLALPHFKDSPEAPATPDPGEVSAAQTKSNIDTARVNAQLNRVNQKTPYGSLTYSQKPSTFNEAGYNSALQAYEAEQQDRTASAANPATTTQVSGNMGEGGGEVGSVPIPTPAPKPLGPAPTREQFTTPSDTWESNIELNPEQQALLDQDTRIKTQLGQTAEKGLNTVDRTMSTPFDASSLSAYRTTPQGGGAQSFSNPNSTYTTGLTGKNIQMGLPDSDYAAQRTSVEDALYSRLNPQLERDRSALDVRLANQGIMPGSDAYKTAVDESNRAATDARYQAVLAGGQEQSRLAGLDLQAGNFANSAQAQDFGQQATNAALNNSVNDTRFNQGLATTQQNNAANQQDFSQQLSASQANNAQRQQQLEEAAYLRSMPLNELNALRTGSQVNNPSFSAVPQTNVANTNTSGNTYQSAQGNQANYNQQASSANATNNATIAAVGTAAAMFF